MLWEDYKLVNVNQHTCIDKIMMMNCEDLEYLELTFTTHLNDGLEFELEPNGKKRSVTSENKIEFVTKSIEAHLAHLRKPFEYMKRGFQDHIQDHMYMIAIPAGIEKQICGMDYVDIEVLKNIT